jgi:peroxiredoxin
VENVLNNIDEFTIVNIGDKLPEFSWLDESGISQSSASLIGKSTVIIFFSKNCQHCRLNFTFLEEEFSLNSNFRLNILAIGRECDNNHIDFYKNKYSFRTPLIADPDRTIYSKFAEKAVPRIYLFDKEGILLKSVRGYKPSELRELVNRIPFQVKQ